jgi:glycosyltransferase involved in cell wall biosynthesis
MVTPVLRVAHLGIKGLPARGGAERVVESLVARMPGLGVAPTVYCERAYTPRDFSLAGVSLVRVPSLAGKYSRQTTINLLSALHTLVLGEYDLIHLHHVEASFVLPLLRLRYPVIATSHGAAYWRAKWSPRAKQILRALEIPFVRFANIATSVAQPDARDLESRFNRRVVYIPNGVVENPRCDPARAQIILEKHHLARDHYLIFVAGRIEPTKGAHLAIQAVYQLCPRVPLLVVGDATHVPDYATQLHQIANANICFEPLVQDQATLFGLMVGSLGLIFPSLFEAMAMVLLEAASLGVPVVCSDLEENRQVMRADALYFESGNAESLACALETGLANRDAWIALARAAQSRIQSEFSWDAIARRYVELYRELGSR